MNGIKTILWDWNGTLLDDTELCCSIINSLLDKRELKKLSIERYKDIFSFPVKDYYEKAGFDFSKEAFKIPTDEFINLYKMKVINANLHLQSQDILSRLATKQFQQIIVSAMEQNALLKSVKEKGIQQYFTEISGINNHYASSKTKNALALISKLKLNPEELCFIGDTVHDHEVAEELKCTCILIANGHQSKHRLRKTGSIVLNDLSELTNYF